MRSCLLTLLLGSTVGCATATLLPEAYEVERVALVSLHARREIAVQQNELTPLLLDGSLGEEVIEMSIADTEAELEGIFGVAAIVPAGKAMQSKKYDLMPEALPVEEWSQVNKMLAVDVDDARLPFTLGVLARDLQVDAAVVVRHEWWLARDRLDIGTSTWAYDRCTLLLVDDDGQVLWRQTVIGRAPSRTMWSSTFQVGFNGATWADEARTLARETARMAWGELKTSYARGPLTKNTTPKNTKPPAKTKALPPPGLTVPETTDPASTRLQTTSPEQTDPGTTSPETTTEPP
ncbi:MAG: hypothetical protein Q8O67_27655 [Deltaproteobacteria bacterium]|nr:hypothetical protein [Deltaproteobacteria bacterium]